MAFDFPTPTAVGQTFTPTGGPTWTWNGTGWTLAGATASVVLLNQQVFTTPGTTPYTPTAGMVSAMVECVGGGGGGGAAVSAASVAFGGGGGGSGGYSRKWLTAAQIGTSQVVTVGAAGAAGNSATTPGGNGGVTSFGSLCVANGGIGGTSANAAANYTLGGAGGAPGTGDITAAGSPGASGAYINSVGMSSPNLGNGGSSIFGGGAVSPSGASNVSTPGIAGRNYGGGGSGANSMLQTGLANGGAGSSGIVIVTEYAAAPVGLPSQATSSLIYNYLGGLTLSYSSGSLTIIAPGTATSDDNAVMMTLTANWSKGLGGPWAPGGTGQAGLDQGTFAASTWYHVFLIYNPTTGAVDVLYSTSATSPFMPTSFGFTKKRRIGSVRTDGTSNILQFIQYGDEFLWYAPVQDANGVTFSSTSTLFPLTVPTGVQVRANVMFVPSGFATGTALIQSPDEQTQVCNVPTGNFNISLGAGQTVQNFVRTNTSGQIRAVVTTAAGTGQLYLVTHGWVDNRGK